MATERDAAPRRSRERGRLARAREDMLRAARRPGLRGRRRWAAPLLAALAACAALAWWMRAPAAPTLDSAAPGGAADEGDAGPLATVFALASDWERNVALYGLLSDASFVDAGRIERWIAAAKAYAPPAPHRHDVIRVLYERYASISPAAAADHVLAGDAEAMWIGAVFGAWAQRDLAASVARAEMLGPFAKPVAAAAILALDLSPAQRERIVRRLGAQAALAALEDWEKRRRLGEPASAA